MYVCMYVCMHACMYVCMYIYIYIYTYIHIHTYILIQSSGACLIRILRSGDAPEPQITSLEKCKIK